MKKPTSNILVKTMVPVVMVGTLVIGIKSCSEKSKQPQTAGTQQSINPVLKDLSPEDLKTLGVEGDTPHDTLRTIVGNFRKVQERLNALDDDNKKLQGENKQLKQTNTNTQDQITQAVGSVRAEEAQKRSQLSSQVSDLSTQVTNLMDQLKNGATPGNHANKPLNGPGSDIPVGLGYDNGLNSSASLPSSDGMQWIEPHDGIGECQGSCRLR